MNDFTKEELESIVDGFDYIQGDPAWRETTGWDDALKEKIQSMIDNYCEHEFREYPLGVTAIPYCNKCKKVIL